MSRLTLTTVHAPELPHLDFSIPMRFKHHPRGARAVLQLYPEKPEHLEMLRLAAIKAGFAGDRLPAFTPRHRPAAEHNPHINGMAWHGMA